MKSKSNHRWIIKIVILSVVISMALTFASTQVLGHAGYVMAFVLLLVFILFGIVFDVIGVAVAAAPEAPFHSMAAHRERGAVEAIRLIRNAEKVTTVCNDVFGGISDIVSGATSVLIITAIMRDFSISNVLFQLFMSGIVTGTIIGGKAFGKTIAIKNSTAVVLRTGKIINLKSRIFSGKRG